MRVLITGATGFVGGAVLSRCVGEGDIEPRVALRTPAPEMSSRVDAVTVGDIGPTTDWAAAVRGVDVVVHCAARVHVMHDRAADPLAEFRRVNVEGTLRLARQAHAAGARRIVFLSSIKVNGEATEPGRPYRADDPPAPLDPYGVSKREGEAGLRRLASDTGLEVVVIRPVLVYGPGVGGNFLSMLRWLQRGVPLPLGAIRNRRSLVAIDNLVDLIVVAMRHPAAAQGTFLVSDGEDLSTTELLRRLASAMGRRARLLPVAAPILRAALTAAGKRAVARRLCSSLQVDIAETKRVLGWAPPVGVDDALARVASWGGAANPLHRRASLGREE